MKQYSKLPVEDIRARVSIVDIVGETVELRKSGHAYTGMCPFHNNTHTPAFAVFPESGTWYCFSEQHGGDVIAYVMQRDSLSFQEAVRYLAEKAGVALPEDPEEVKTSYEVLAAAANYFNEYLRHSPWADPVRDYLVKVRGLSDDSIMDFNVGLSPHNGVELIASMQPGYLGDDLVRAGVAYISDEGGFQDMFRDRIMFPICDERGNVLGFGGRATRKDQQPKFLNSHNNDIFDKSSCLFGLNLATKAIRQADKALVVEGYFDVIACRQYGFENTVGAMGTSLSEEQIRILKQYTRNIVMVMDGDDAGAKAVRQMLSSHKVDALLEDRPEFDAGGGIRAERKFGVNISVATLPPGQDPDDVGKEGIIHAISESKPLVSWLIDQVCWESSPHAAPREKADMVNRLARVVSLIPDSVERDALCRDVASKFVVDYRAVAAAVGKATTDRGNRKDPALHNNNDPLVIEAAFVASCMSDPDSLNALNRNLRYGGMEPVSPEDFDDSIYRELIKIILQSLEQWDEDPALWVSAHIPPEMLGAAERLGNTEINFPDAARRCEYQLEALLGMRIAACSRRIAALASLAEMPGEEKARTITDELKTRRIIERALKFIKEHKESNHE